MKKSSSLLLLAAVIAAAFVRPADAQFPMMDGFHGGPQKMNQAIVTEESDNEKEANKMEGFMERALHRMGAEEKKALNEALVERGSLVTADGKPIKQNEKAGEQVIDPRTPKGFGNPFFRAIHVEQNIKVNNLLTEFEQKELARLKWQEGDDVKANATEEISIGTGWTPVVAQGEMATPEVRYPEFMALLEVSPNRIIRRVCESCGDDEFKDIYYKRLTDTYKKNLLTMMWKGPFDKVISGETTNECWVDFTLHSTYEDAIAGTNPWQHCHPDTKKFNTGKDVGFPSYSGPEKHDANNINQGTSQQADYAFFVETPDWIPIASSWRLDMRGDRDGMDIEAREISKLPEYLERSPNRIIRYVCNRCTGVYKDVYYRHMAPATQSVEGIATFILKSFQPHGVEGYQFGQDFNIYSTYEDAKNNANAWEYCEYLPPESFGFPGNCRPYLNGAATPNQWVRMGIDTGSMLNKPKEGEGTADTCLYVERSEETKTTDREGWMSDDEEMELFFYGKKDEPPACLAKGSARHNTLGNTGMESYGSTAVDVKYISPTWFGNPADTYQGSRDFCKSKGMDLCPREIVCPNGPNGMPDGGQRGGDHWVPVLDEDNQWIQVGTWFDGGVSTCKAHEEIPTIGYKPLWGLYGEKYYGSMPFADLVQCCGVAEQYAYDDYAGWYDVRRCGSCHDFCFWMGVEGTSYDPIFAAGSNPWHTPVAYDTAGNMKGFFTCILSGSSASDKSTDLKFLKDKEKNIQTFPYRKCSGEGQGTLDYRPEEFMGCYRTGYPPALPDLVANGQTLSYSKCADACAARNYHYFGRTGNGQCRCGGRTQDDYTFARNGLVKYEPNGKEEYCNCDADVGAGESIGSHMCTYRVVDQFDPNTARKHHPCRYLPAQDMRKMCYIACRDGNKSMANKLTCKMLETMGMTYLAKMISKHYDDGGDQLHMLGGDVNDGTKLGTF